MTTYNGRCHCGQTEWTAKLDGDAHILCHCDACKILSGGAYTLNQLGNKSDFHVTKGEPKVYTYYGDSGNPVHCNYCSNCTAHLYHHQTVNGDKIVVRTSLLKDAKGLPVGAELYVKDKFHWQPQIAETVFQAGPQ